MPLNVAKVNNIDQRTKDLVIGYIKSRLYNDQIIPSIIIATCILFYHIYEYFTVHGKHIMLDETSTIMSIHEAIACNAQSVYGNFCINGKDNCIYSWTIKILKYNVRDRLEFGISASNKSHPNGTEFSTTIGKSIYYYYSVSRNYLCRLNRVKESDLYKFVEGDVIKLELNTVNETLQFYVNGQSRGIPFNYMFFGDYTFHFVIAVTSYKRISPLSLQLIMFDKKCISPLPWMCDET